MLANSEHLPRQNIHSFVFRWLHITLHVDLETIFGYLGKQIEEVVGFTGDGPQ